MSEREEQLFRRLPVATVVAHEEVLAMIKHRQLSSRGIGWIDAHLLASALAGSARLWSADKDLANAATKVGAAFRVS
jgi:predicted nucleic acid-binding protein